MRDSKTCLSHWYPIVKDIVPTPKTEIIRVNDPKALMMWFCGEDLSPEQKLVVDGLVDSIDAAASRIGYPVFLRTGLTSDKRSWGRTCYLNQRQAVRNHVGALIEFSECADIEGLPFDVWVVRELLKTEPAFTAFNGMPIVKEFRCFGRDGKVECLHPYWPQDAIRRASAPDWRERLEELAKIDFLTESALRAGTALVTGKLGGYWSVDWLLSNGQYYLTDMAEGEKSFHWKDCERNAPRS